MWADVSRLLLTRAALEEIRAKESSRTHHALSPCGPPDRSRRMSGGFQTVILYLDSCLCSLPLCGPTHSPSSLFPLPPASQLFRRHRLSPSASVWVGQLICSVSPCHVFSRAMQACSMAAVYYLAQYNIRACMCKLWGTLTDRSSLGTFSCVSYTL